MFALATDTAPFGDRARVRFRLAAAGSTTTAIILVLSGGVSVAAQTDTCGARAGGSRWLVDSYQITHTYGIDDPDEWVASYGGLDAVGDTVFLYDQRRPGVLHLTGTLSLRGSFGQAGRGPGEFGFPFPVTWIDDNAEGHIGFDGTTLVVYDRLDVASFRPDGTFVRSTNLGHPSMGAGVRFVSPEPDGSVVYGLDSIASGRRRLQTWRIRPDASRELLWERPVPWIQPASGGTNPGRREARSYWARYHRCYVVSDGGSGLLWIYDAEKRHVDSMPLPEWRVPPFGAVASDRSGLVIGGRTAGRQVTEPALLSRWTGLIIDPDGYAWVRAWTSSREDFTVFVISLTSGRAVRVDLPAFPRAFGPPGVFYAAKMREETEEQYVARYAERER